MPTDIVTSAGYELQGMAEQRRGKKALHGCRKQVCIVMSSHLTLTLRPCLLRPSPQPYSYSI